MDSTNNSSIEDRRRDAQMVWTLTNIFGIPTPKEVQRLYREIKVGTVVYALHREGEKSTHTRPSVQTVMENPQRYRELIADSLYRLWMFSDTHYHTTQYQREVEWMFELTPNDTDVFNRFEEQYRGFKDTTDYEFVMGTLKWKG